MQGHTCRSSFVWIGCRRSGEFAQAGCEWQRMGGCSFAQRKAG